LLEVERLALGEILFGGNVEQDDIAELLCKAQVGELAADVACTNQSNLLSRHGLFSGTEFVEKRGVDQHLGARNSAEASTDAPGEFGFRARVCRYGPQQAVGNGRPGRPNK
jgi:hypothetical protein